MSTLEVKFGSATISYRAEGAGYPLVLLHGVGSSADSWEFQLNGLSGQFRVIAWDAPGYGRSTDLDADAPEAADYAASLAGFIAALKISRCHLVGHSMGGLIAAAFAKRFPDSLETLTLADCASGYRWNPTEPLPEKLKARLDDLRDLGPDGLAKKRAANLLSKGAGGDAIERVRGILARIRPAGYQRALKMVARGDILSEVAQLTKPVLVVCGSEDAVTLEPNVRAIAEAIPGAVYRSLPGLGHASYIEGPELFNDAVVKFILEHGN